MSAIFGRHQTCSFPAMSLEEDVAEFVDAMSVAGDIAQKETCM